MTDRPVIFSAPMVRALLGGRKTQTRRLAHVERRVKATADRPEYWGVFPSPWQKVQPGDRLWVREAIRYSGEHDNFYYAADDLGVGTDLCHRFFQYRRASRPSIHMPRWASRLTLTVTEVRRQRLQEISEEDARAEGVEPSRAGQGANGEPVKTYRTGFVRIWGELHGTESWLGNPEVVAISFSCERRNIDAREAA